MELSTILGMGGAVVIVMLTVILEGGSLLSFAQLSSFILILGGSIAVSLTSFSIKEIVMIPKYFLKAIFPMKKDIGSIILTFVSFSEKARREGLLSLEDDVANVDDRMIKLGLQLVIDGNDPEIVRSILDDLSDSIKHDEKIPAELFETLGGFSPTIGIIGTVMGLVHVLENLGGAGGISKLGEGIAVAFIATFYGIGFANLIWLPLSNKIKKINTNMSEYRKVVVCGILAVQSGDNPRIVKERLISQISEESTREKMYKLAEGEGESSPPPSK